MGILRSRELSEEKMEVEVEVEVRWRSGGGAERHLRVVGRVQGVTQ